MGQRVCNKHFVNGFSPSVRREDSKSSPSEKCRPDRRGFPGCLGAGEDSSTGLRWKKRTQKMLHEELDLGARQRLSFRSQAQKPGVPCWGGPLWPELGKWGGIAVCRKELGFPATCTAGAPTGEKAFPFLGRLFCVRRRKWV